MVDEFQDTNRLQCELIDLLAHDDAELFFVGDEFQSIYRFRHADVEVFRERREQRRRRAAADAELPLAARGARRRQPPLRARTSATSSSRSSRPGGFPDPAFGPAVELLVTDKASYTDTGVALAARPRRGTSRGACASSSTPARRRPARSCSSSPPAPTRELYEEELRAARPADLPRDRPRLLRPAAGASTCSPTCGCCTTATTTRRSSRVLASPFVGVSNDALVLLRRAAPKRPLFTGLERGLPEGLVGAGRAALPGVPPALRPARRARARRSRSSGSASRSSPSTTTTSPCSRSGTAGAATRTCASSRGSRARTRSCAAPTSRASSASSPSRTRSARRELEAVAEEEGTDVGPAADDPRGEGARVQGRRRRRRGPRPRRGRTRDEILCLPDGRFGFRVADPTTGKRLTASELRERAGRPSRRRRRPSGCASTTSR